MKHTICITGAAGFIGSHLTDALLAAGHQVVGIDNFNQYYSPTIKHANIKQAQSNTSFTLIETDIRDTDTINQVFADHQIDTVIHLAARAGVRPSLQKPHLYYDVNIMGTLNILEAMKKHRVSNLVFASSSSVYGNRDEGPFIENDNTDAAVSPYGASKKAGEVLCHSYAHLYDMSIKCLRFFTAYGPRNRPDMACFKFTHAISNGLELTQYGDGTTGRDYTYIDDIVSGIIAASKLDHTFEIFNLGNSSPTLLKDLISTIEQVVGKKAVIKQQPIQPGDVKLTFAGINKAKKLLKFKPQTDLKTGLSKLYDWYQQNSEIFYN